MFSNIKTPHCQNIRKMLRTAALATLCASAAAFSSPAVFSNTAAKVYFDFCVSLFLLVVN
jgi:hypothetical protein